MTYGKTIKNFNFPVLNERSARAGAGLMFLLGMITFALAFFERNFTLLNIVVVAFTIEFLLRIIDPHKAPFYALGGLIVRRQKPEWSGAVQKRFAWSLGLAMAVSMIFIAVIFQIRGALPFSICTVCLILLWLESSFGICVGCKIYYGLMKAKIIKKPKVLPSCPGGACPIHKK